MRHARRTLLLILWVPLAAMCGTQEPDLSATQLAAAPGVEGKVLALDLSGRIFGPSSISPPTGNGISAAAFAPDGRVWAASAAFVGRLSAGGSGWDWLIDQKVDAINGIAADANGAVYEVGRLGGDVWIAKFDASGSSPVLAWQRTFGGAGNEAGNAVTTDGRTGVYLTGWSDSQDWGAPGRAAGRHAFVLKLDAANGSPQYLNWLADSAGAEGLGIAVMLDLSVVVTGRTGLGNLPSTGGFAGETCEPNSAFLARVSPAGDSLLYSGCLSGDGQQEGQTVAVDTQGNAWVAGSTTSARFAGEDAVPGIRRAWIARVSPDGSSLEFVKGMAAMAPAEIRPMRGVLLGSRRRRFSTHGRSWPRCCARRRWRWRCPPTAAAQSFLLFAALAIRQPFSTICAAGDSVGRREVPDHHRYSSERRCTTR